MKKRKKPVRPFAHDDIVTIITKVKVKESALVKQHQAVLGFATNRRVVVIPSRLPLASELPEPVVEEELVG